MLLKRRYVLCSTCGFFCWHVQHISGEGPYRFAELGQHAREDFQAGSFGGTEEDGETQDYYQIHCLRKQWAWSPHYKPRPYYVEADDIRKPRQCIYYIGYHPGFGPEEHKELRREGETRRTIFKASVLAAIIGASAAILAQLLYVLLAT